MTRVGVVLASVVVLSFAAAPASAAPRKSTKSPAEIAAYWTDARMKEAKPRYRARAGGGGGTKTTSDWSSYAVPTPYTAQTRLNGKVFFTLDGANYVCSGTAVAASQTVNLVWTAGHCVTDGVDSQNIRHDATAFMFVPAYLNGNAPFGRWPMTALDSTDSWESSNGQDFRYDLGAVRVKQTVPDGSGGWKETGATFTDALGSTRPIVFGLQPSTSTRFVSYGYPAAGKFKGNQQHACASPFRQFDPWNTASPAPMQISCDMTGGSSGGGWIRDDNKDGNSDGADDANEPLVSVNSYGYSFESKTMYGPQMPASDEAEALYNRMK